MEKKCKQQLFCNEKSELKRVNTRAKQKSKAGGNNTPCCEFACLSGRARDLADNGKRSWRQLVFEIVNKLVLEEKYFFVKLNEIRN